MIVISEDGMRSVPFDQFIFSVESLLCMELSAFTECEGHYKRDGKEYILTATKDPDTSFIILGSYKTKEAAIEELRLMYTYYSMPKPADNNKVYKVKPWKVEAIKNETNFLF